MDTQRDATPRQAHAFFSFAKYEVAAPATVVADETCVFGFCASCTSGWQAWETLNGPTFALTASRVSALLRLARGPWQVAADVTRPSGHRFTHSPGLTGHSMERQCVEC